MAEGGSEEERWRRRLDRERQARKQAEALLEQKSSELYQANLDLKGAVNAFEASSSRLAAILDHTFAGILVVDETGRMIEANRAAKAMFGRSRDETDKASVLDWLDPSSRAVCEAAEASSIGADGHQRSEIWHEVLGCRVDGSTFPLEFVITKLNLEESHHQIWILRDLTQQRAAEEVQKALEQNLQRAQKLEALGTMAGGVAHEINTPVQFIGSNIAYLGDVFDDLFAVIDSYRDLRDGAVAGADLSELVAKVREAEKDADLEGLVADVPEAITQTETGVARISRIIQAIKELASGGGEERGAIDVNRAVDSTIEFCRSEWSCGSSLERNFASDLPTIDGDVSKFNQVICHLIVNAAQAIDQCNRPSKGVIAIRTGRDDQAVIIEVADNGCGIAAGLHERIFEPFFTTKEVGKGTGQGLALCNKIVTDHLKGTISLRSKKGEGTTFTVSLPSNGGVRNNGISKAAS